MVGGFFSRDIAEIQSSGNRVDSPEDLAHKNKIRFCLGKVINYKQDDEIGGVDMNIFVINKHSGIGSIGNRL